MRAGHLPALGALALAVALAASNAQAETRRVVLKNGDDLYGEVTRRADGWEVVTISGDKRRLPFAAVESVEGLGGGPKGGKEPPAGESPTPPPEPAPGRLEALPAPGQADPGPPADGRPVRQPDTGIEPWYLRQKLSLLAATASVLALFLAGALRGEHRGGFRLFKRVRVLVLLLGLVVLGIYAVDLQMRRDDRRNWTRPLHVAVLLVARAPLPERVTAAFRERTEAAAARLEAERRRYQPDAPRPVHFHLYGPVSGDERPAPPASAEDAAEGTSGADLSGLFDRLVYGFELRRFLGRLDTAAGLDSDRFDVRMYVFAAPVVGRHPHFVEGIGEEGGELGMVDVDLDLTMIDAAWIAVAHEVLHTVGATDKYTPAGRAAVPEGLAEPERVPQFPQRFAEIMAGEIPTAPDDGRLVDRLEDVRIGRETAREIGWVGP